MYPINLNFIKFDLLLFTYISYSSLVEINEHSSKLSFKYNFFLSKYQFNIKKLFVSNKHNTYPLTMFTTFIQVVVNVDF